MSGIPGLPGITGFLDFSEFNGGDQAPFRIIDPESSNLVAEVTIEEDHLDQMIITEHPVEQSAAIADHAYRRPRELRLRVGWSNAFGGSPTFAEEVYNQLVALQWQRRPFSIYTGKGVYQNMLIGELRVTTNSALEYTCLADIYFREVLLVNTQTVSGGVPANPQQLTNPSINQPTSSAGQVNTTPAGGFEAEGTSTVTVVPNSPANAVPPSTAGFPAIQGFG